MYNYLMNIFLNPCNAFTIDPWTSRTEGVCSPPLALARNDCPTLGSACASSAWSNIQHRNFQISSPR
ncbi:unnamed protein product [Timema podura]|uniref:Uncharacterized protein n=1 Tax=Timema podura TaxID=61482 RepID=A0ABN7PKX1_TIMPD|nr:unnamed protein product [Timema podura]